MSDERLRELERRWKQSGTAEAEAEFLQGRIRAGELPRERLPLAAYCGSEGAKRALGEGAPQVPDTIEAWLLGLHERDQDLMLRALVVIARQVLPVWESAKPDDRRPLRAIEAAEEVLETGSKNSSLLSLIADEANDASVETEWGPGLETFAAACASSAAEYADSPHPSAAETADFLHGMYDPEWDEAQFCRSLGSKLLPWILLAGD